MYCLIIAIIALIPGPTHAKDNIHNSRVLQGRRALDLPGPCLIAMRIVLRNSLIRSILSRSDNPLKLISCATNATNSSSNRCFSSSARIAIHKKEGDFDLSKVNRPLDKEIEYNNRLLEDEQLNVNTVKDKYSRLLQEQGWEISSQTGSSLVELKATRGPISISVSFDAAYVVQATRSSEMMEEDAEMEQVEEEDRLMQSKNKNKKVEEEFDDGFVGENEDQFDHDVTPFTFNIKLANESAILSKFLNFEVEVLPTESPGKDEISLTNLTLESKEESISQPGTDLYLGPDYHSLDDSLRDQFDNFIGKNFKKFIPFIREYSEAKEAEEYGNWLNQVKKIINH